MKRNKITTDALGFSLTVTINIGDFNVIGSHKTFEDCDTKLVGLDAQHTINIKSGLERDAMNYAVSHEVYHLFYSIRHLITADEEAQAETFGGLIQAIHLTNGPDAMPAIREEMLNLLSASEKSFDRANKAEKELEGEQGVLSMAVARLGGQVEFAPTHRGNFLQRIDQLREIETNAIKSLDIIQHQDDEIIALESKLSRCVAALEKIASKENQYGYWRDIASKALKP